MLIPQEQKKRTYKLFEGNVTTFFLNLIESLNSTYSRRLNNSKQDKLKEINS